METKVLVTGARGQLGQCLKAISTTIEGGFQFVFVGSKELDIVNKHKLEAIFIENKFNYCINCAAYTAVDKAENNEGKASEVNVIGVSNLAEVCKIHNTTLIHISTDFVFDGKSSTPYNESDETNPISVYGATKLRGEKEIINKLNSYFIIRTSWLYSEYGNNFVKTMLKLGEERTELNVVDDQIGSPTYAMDLAQAIFTIIKKGYTNYGIYNYSNEGEASWFDFAKAIFDISNKDVKLNAIPTKSFPTPANRPHYSVLDKEKIKKNMEMKIPHWRESLEICLKQIN